MAADGAYGPLRSEVRGLNGLSSEEYPDTQVDQHLQEAFEDVQNVLKITFATSAQAFTDLELDSKRGFFIDSSDNYSEKMLRFKKKRTIIYMADFLQSTNRLPLLTVTKVETRSDEDASYTTLTEGMGDDYTIDLISNSIDFNYPLQDRGVKTIRLTGTYGVVANPMTSLAFKYKRYIGLLAALSGLKYAVGSGFNKEKSVSIGGISVNESEFSTTFSTTYDRLKETLREHIIKHNLSNRRVIVSIA